MKPKSSKTVSQCFGIDPSKFEETGALDSILNVDSKLFLDPALLRDTVVPEFSASYEKVKSTFVQILKILKHSKSTGDVFFRNADKLLYGKEIKGLCIGYSNQGTAGSGFGPKLRTQVLILAKEIIAAGSEDPEIFELVGLLEDGIGPDRISDLTCRIIALDIYKYSERIFSKFDIVKKTITYGKSSFNLPINPYNGESVKLLPMSLLCDLPLAEDWQDIDLVSLHNANLRASVNQIIGNTWREAQKQSKRDLRDVIISHPELVQDIIEQYRKKSASPYDFKNDPKGQIIWKRASDKASSENPLHINWPSRPKPEDINNAIRMIIEKFKDLVENNGLSSLLYNEGLKPKHEEASQKLFYGIADCYCEINNIDLTRECNAGRGPVDFKFSSGYNSRVVVEIKLSTNGKLEHGFNSQIAEYRKAEKTDFSHYIVLNVVSGSVNRVNKLKDLSDSLKKSGDKCPDLYFVDAIPKRVCSNRAISCAVVIGRVQAWIASC